MRTEFLYEFAERLHFDGRQVDALRVFDFVTYVRGIKTRQKQEKKAAEEAARKSNG